jgi:hypothetical protein
LMLAVVAVASLTMLLAPLLLSVAVSAPLF